MVWSYIRYFVGAAARKMFAVVMLLRSKSFYVFMSSLAAFPRTYLLLYNSFKTFNLGNIFTKGVLVFSEEIGASVFKLYKGLQLLNGNTRPGAVVQVFQLPGFLTGLPTSVLAVFLVFTGFLTPYVFYRLSRRFVVFASSRTPGIVHYVFIAALFSSLVVLYGVRHGLGLDFVPNLLSELDLLVEGFLRGQAAGVNGSVNGSYFNASKNASNITQ